MPNGINDWDDEDDDDNNSGSNGDGTDVLKTLRKKAKADAKLIADLTAKVDGFAKTQREETAKKVLESKGVNPKAARLLLKDLDEVNETTIDAWLKDNGDLFAPLKPANEEKSAEELANLAELQRQNGLTNAGGTPGNAQDLETRILATRSMSPAEGRIALAEIVASQQ